MRPSGKRPHEAGSLLAVPRLAEDPSVKAHHRISREHRSIHAGITQLISRCNPVHQLRYRGSKHVVCRRFPGELFLIAGKPASRL